MAKQSKFPAGFKELIWSRWQNKDTYKSLAREFGYTPKDIHYLITEMRRLTYKNSKFELTD